MPRVNIGPFHLNRDDTTKLANKPFRRNIDAFLEAQALDTNLEKALKAEIEAISGTCCQGCLVGNRKLNSNIRCVQRFVWKSPIVHLDAFTQLSHGVKLSNVNPQTTRTTRCLLNQQHCNPERSIPVAATETTTGALVLLA
ncbi:unnamed protein product [Fusarium graminearum]|uniref:Chromosome 1, complete genome n=2 Tax=Gibberella zeae TaxID=5518 RepID=I1RBE9_GIBZE|nr:hypothetical protein FGSG_00867 [Fusarium graminearum PH-1]EYB26495.1 hypothetical protein FG05_00867 [Fusarium graminearum]ESU06109.1 hypothetical protein FGSG_00867 [Fusarium graminearum PH-1]CAF3512209.1 unnamed protein product [Fusarium graminearum]CAF3586450.1 unnamed protein product [Fusarium graminearum]CAG1967092.1 unnamed protein product [Fusarium graminearum]|eukprot:XP_011316594.1 hypothetical protein FGSG_00867 [Fusarium graminearum PH-1]